MKNRLATRSAWVAVALLLGTAPAFADTLTVTAGGSGVGDNPLEATATFDITGNTLTLTLENTSDAPTEIPSELLSGVYFDVFGSPTVTPVSAALASGSTVLFGPDGGGDVGGEFGFRDDLQTADPGSFNGAQYGVSESGLDVFGPGDLFPGSTNLEGPAAPNGLNYGLISEGGLGPDANAPLSGPNPLIDNSVVFTFTMSDFPEVFGPDFEPSTALISNISFQYGTSQSQPNFQVCLDCPDPNDPETPVMPEPSTMLLLTGGLGAMAWRSRKRA